MERITMNIPVLALRGLTAFPHQTLSFDVEREISIFALDNAMEGDRRLFLVTQRKIGVSEPEEQDLYEIGTVFMAAEGRKKAKERKKLAGVLAGSMRDAAWNSPAVPFDFFDAKGVLENLARELALPKVRFRALSAEEAPQLQPGRAAEMMANGAVIGWVGEIHPLVADAFGAEPPVVAFELDVAALVRACRPARDYVDVPTFPAVTVDQAFVVAEDVPHEKMVQVMTSAGGKLLESVALFDVYRDAERVGAGKKSMAYSLVYRAPDRTLTSEEVERAHGKLVSKVEKATGAEIRG